MRCERISKLQQGLNDSVHSHDAVVIGGGPAGLMAAQQLAAAGRQVHVYDAMPSVGRKFLLAGRGGLNLTHSEPADVFLSRYGARVPWVASWLAHFGADQVRAWAQALGIDTFVGTSGRVFPAEMKAAPLLRAWLARLRAAGVQFHMRQRWHGWAADGTLLFQGPAGAYRLAAGATVLALGGASWPQLGSDGAWVEALSADGTRVQPLAPANCGFDVVGGQGARGESRREFLKELIGQGEKAPSGWTPHFVERHAGAALKSVAMRFADAAGASFSRRGEFVVTATGVEGSLIYAVSALVREEIARNHSATVHLDLLPDHSAQRVLAETAHPRGARSLSSHLKSRLGLGGVKMGLLHELLSKEQMADSAFLAAAIKELPLVLCAARPVAEAISTAGGVALEDLNEHLMLLRRPGVFCCGEMLDWEAPTGGYLLTACLASGWLAGEGAAAWRSDDGNAPI
ncbi:aminoacetone oxidase family FAD-binding enzyme [Simplicispira suum]|uniref:Aminoacetone oxidase family FAD-binding enzyme n=2 Tax=Simplicispira suum TaxID=2109915 RepID=A0A2S0MW34_9BURK|nr:aminoacetone oxidase family FAD-binding enzyme [Simplicispira suum]